MNGIPIFYDHANAFAFHQKPYAVFTKDNRLTMYFQRYLLQKAMSVFEWTLPKKWEENRGRDYFLYCLYWYGFMAVIETDKFGVIPQHCTLGGYGVFYEPKWAVIANPLLKGIRQPIIGKQCELIKLQPDYGGAMDVIYHYAELMALASQSVFVNLLNSKFAYVFAADNKAKAESFKKLFDTIASGEPAAFFDKALMNPDGTPNWQLFVQNLKQQYIASDILSDLAKIEDEFNTVIGINNANTEKRERMNLEEVNANNDETKAIASGWYDSLTKSIDRVKDMFGDSASELSVKWRDFEGGADFESVPVNSRSLQLRQDSIR